MENENFVPVEGEPNLYRDRDTGAIINTDNVLCTIHENETKKADRTGRT